MIDPFSGVVDWSTNSGTQACGMLLTGPGDSKGADIDRLPFRLRYLGYVLNRSLEYNDLASKVMWIGQGFDHYGCGI